MKPIAHKRIPTEHDERLSRDISRCTRSQKKKGSFFPAAFICFILSLFFITSIATQVFAAPVSTSAAGSGTKPTETQAVTEDPLGRSTPYGTVMGFLTATEAEDYQRASQYLESALSANRKEALARDLKLVLDRGLKINMDTLSKKPEGNPESLLSANLEKVGTAKYEGESLDILLHRVDQKEATPIWLFSSETLRGVPEAAVQLEPPLVERIFPKRLWEKRIAFLPLLHWIFVLIILPFLVLLSWLFSRALIRLVRPAALRRVKNLTKNDMARLRMPITVLTIGVLLRIVSPLSAYLYIRMFWFGTGTILMILAFTWFLIRLTRIVRRLQIDKLHQAQLLNRIALSELIAWLVQGLLVIVGLLLLLKQAGFELTTALAGLSIGGVAIAFAAQKTIENLFGSVMVIADQPVRVGDFCQAGNIEGTVESIGLRSTRIRTLNRTLVTVPNGQFSAMSIENLAHRDKFLCRHKFGLRYETTAEQLQHVLEDLRTMLSENPAVEPSTYRTRFIRFGDFSLDVEVFAYVVAPDWPGFLAIQEALLIRVMGIIEGRGTSFAFPSQTMYVAKDTIGGGAVKSETDEFPHKKDG